MAVPQQIVGAWRRSGLILNGARKVDYCDVIWLQTPEWYVDIRLLIDPTAVLPTEGVPGFFYKEFAFAGISKFENSYMTWDHLIDSSLTPSVDSNPITWEDGVAFETGKVPMPDGEATFIEEWLRMTGDDVKWSAETSERSARIEVGRFAVEISDERPTGQFKASRFHLTESGWELFGSVTA
jgi:hypothetical protein